ncbi:MAG: peptide ABC transporter substrate-binding protein, partial [Pseudobdellovibrionaceae bacterium]
LLLGLCIPVLLFLILNFSFFYKPDNQQNGLSCLKINLPEGDPPSLHPHLCTDIRGRTLGKALFEGLTRLNKNGKAELAGAEKVEISPSSSHYTFIIRPHQWSNGEPVTAYHFAQAWKKAIQPDSLCVRADLFYIIKNAKKAKLGQVPIEEIGVKALDERTLLVELEQPSPYFLDLVSHPIFSPMPNSNIKEPIVFNGPFNIGKWKRGSVLELVKNPHYWDASHVQLDKVSIFMVADTYTQFSLFEKNELDLVGDPFDSFPLDILASAIKDPRFGSKEISRVNWIYVNVNAMPFQSAKIRKAFSYAINRTDLTKYLLFADSPCQTILPNTLTLLGKEEATHDADIAQANLLLEEGMAELGLTRKTFPSITLSYCTYGYQKTVYEAIQEMWKKNLGIHVRLEGSEWNVFSSQLNLGQFQLGCCMRSAVYEDPFYFLEIFKDKSYSYNCSRWENQEYQNLLDQAIISSDAKQRKLHLKQAEKLLIEAMPVIPIYSETCKYILNDQISGFEINGSGYSDFKTISFKNTEKKS